MKSAKHKNLSTAVHSIITQTLSDLCNVKTFGERTFELEILEVKQSFVVQKLLQMNMPLRELLKDMGTHDTTRLIVKAQSNFFVDYDRVLEEVVETCPNVSHAVSYTPRGLIFFSDKLGLDTDSPILRTFDSRTKISTLTLVFAHEVTTFEEIRDLITSFVLLNSHLRFCLRSLSETHLMRVISASEQSQGVLRPLINLTTVLPMDDDTELDLERLLNSYGYDSQSNFYASTLYYLNRSLLTETEDVIINELNTLTNLTTSKSMPFALKNNGDGIQIDTFFAIRLIEGDIKPKTKNKLLIMLYHNGIPMLNSAEQDFEMPLVGIGNEIISQLSAKTKKRFFPNANITPTDGTASRSVVQLTVEYDKFSESQPIILFVIVNLLYYVQLESECPGVLGSSKLMSNVAKGISKDLTDYLEESLLILPKSNVFNSLEHKKKSNLEEQHIPMLANLMSELSEEIFLDESLGEFAKLPKEARESRVKKALVDICLFEGALGGDFSEE